MVMIVCIAIYVLSGTMGSFGMFAAPCWRCMSMQPRRYGSGVDCCVICYVEIKRSLVVDRIDFGFQVEDSFRQDLVLFAAPHKKLQQLHFLRCALLAHDSPFRLFTYCSNGLAGNISETEDILDRMFSFL